MKAGEYIFYDCSAESPKGRRSLCFDREAPDCRKEHKPKDSAIDKAAAVGIELLTEEDVEPGEDTFLGSASLAALRSVTGASTPFLCITMEGNLTLPPRGFRSWLRV